MLWQSFTPICCNPRKIKSIFFTNDQVKIIFESRWKREKWRRRAAAAAYEPDWHEGSWCVVVAPSFSILSSICSFFFRWSWTNDSVTNYVRMKIAWSASLIRFSTRLKAFFSLSLSLRPSDVNDKLLAHVSIFVIWRHLSSINQGYWNISYSVSLWMMCACRCVDIYLSESLSREHLFRSSRNHLIVARLPPFTNRGATTRTQSSVKNDVKNAVFRNENASNVRCKKAPSIREGAIVSFRNVLERKIDTYFI